MYRSHRIKLQSSLYRSPCEELLNRIHENLSGIFFGVLICAGFCGILFIVSQMIVFFGGHYFLKLWDEDEHTVTVFTVYAHPLMETVRIAGCLLILFSVFRGLKRKNK